MNVVITEQNNVIVNSEELIGTTEHLTLYTKLRINQRRYNRLRQYSIKLGWIFTSSLVILDLHRTKTKRQKMFRGLTLRRLMSYIYIYMEHPFLMFLDHTQRRSTVGRTPLDE